MMVSMDDLTWLAAWYERHCDGEWEHEYGVTIETLDNPGWSLRIELTGTSLENIPFTEERIEELDLWVRYWKDDGEHVFNAVGSPQTLPAMISRFRQWVSALDVV